MNLGTSTRSSRHAARAPLLLLHGFMGAPMSWSAVAMALTHPGPVLTPVLPGHGRPPRPVPATFWDAVDQLAADLAEPAFVVGYSLGGRLGLGLACRHPRRVRGLIAVGAHPGLRAESERDARVRWEDAQALALEARGLSRFIDAWEQLPLFASQSALPLPVRAAQRRIREAHDANALARVLTVLGTGNMPPLALEATRVPVTLVTGEHDVKLASAARELTAIAPQISHQTVPAVGHNPLLEAPLLLGRLIDERLTAWSKARTQETHA